MYSFMSKRCGEIYYELVQNIVDVLEDVMVLQFYVQLLILKQFKYTPKYVHELS